MVEAVRRRLGRDRLDIIERHGIVAVAAEIEAGFDPAGAGFDQRDRKTAGAVRRHRNMFGIPGEGNAARPDSVPSAPSMRRSFGPAGATVMVPSGEEMFACANSHPASMVSASGTASAKRPAAPNTLKPSARLAPEPPHASGTHDNGSPASVRACQSGAFQPPFLSLLMVCASARSANIFSAVSTTMFSLSAKAFLVFGRHISARRFRRASGADFLGAHDEEKPQS